MEKKSNSISFQKKLLIYKHRYIYLHFPPKQYHTVYIAPYLIFLCLTIYLRNHFTSLCVSVNIRFSCEEWKIQNISALQNQTLVFLSLMKSRGKQPGNTRDLQLSGTQIPSVFYYAMLHMGILPHGPIWLSELQPLHLCLAS